MKKIKIYISGKTIELTNRKDIEPDFNGFILQSGKLSKNKLIQVVIHFITLDLSDRLLIVGNPSVVLKIIAGYFQLIEAAGGIIENSDGKILFIFRLGVWDLPKGKIDIGETPRQASVRECEEECAVTGLRIRKKFKDTWHMYQVGKEWVIKRTHWYLMFTEFSGKLIPQHNESIQHAEWFSSQKSKTIIKKSYPAITELMKDYFNSKSSLKN